MRRIIVLWALFALPELAVADDANDFSFPTPIDLSVERQLLTERFPKIASDVPRLRAIGNYRQALELYRIGTLEAYNARIKSVCEGLNTTERLVNAAFASGDMSTNKKSRYERRIEAERMKCRVDNKAGSDYWALYDDLLGLYQQEARNSFEELERCNRNNDCRQGSR